MTYESFASQFLFVCYCLISILGTLGHSWLVKTKLEINICSNSNWSFILIFLFKTCPWVKKLSETHSETRFRDSKCGSPRFCWSRRRFVSSVPEQNAFRSLRFSKRCETPLFSNAFRYIFKTKRSQTYINLKKTRFAYSLTQNDTKRISLLNAFRGVYDRKHNSQHFSLKRREMNPFHCRVLQRFMCKKHFS